MDKFGIYYTIIFFSAGITYLIHALTHEFINMTKKEWIILVSIVLIPIVICTYAIGAYINYLYNIPKNNQIFIYLILIFFSVIVPISTSYIKRNRNEKNQKELNNRLKKLRKYPDITNDQKSTN